jgi:hypothetical protein
MPAADDAAEIWPRLMRLRRICFRKLDLPVSTCWCMKAGPDGRDIPCSEANEPTGFDLLGKPDAVSKFVATVCPHPECEDTSVSACAAEDCPKGLGSINLPSPIRYRSFREAFGDAAAKELEDWGRYLDSLDEVTRERLRQQRYFVYGKPTGCRCPASPGTPCPLTAEECYARAIRNAPNEWEVSR